MKFVYLESSVVLAWLLDEPHAIDVMRFSAADRIVMSELTLTEVRRGLARMFSGNSNPTQHRKLLQMLDQAAEAWEPLAITADILLRAGESFPVEPVRTLDAIHLASALELRRIYPELQVLSLDKRIIVNARELGFVVKPKD